MNEGDGVRDGDKRSAAAVLRTVPRVLREDLLTVARDPLPRQTWLGWLPHAHAVLLVAALGITDLGHYSDLRSAAPMLVALMSLLQTAAAVLALSRPAPAWWLSTLALFVTAALAEGGIGRDMVWPWSVPGIALHTLLLLLLALRVRPWSAIAALAVTLVTGLVNLGLASHPHNEDLARGTIAFAIAVVVGASLRMSRVARSQLVEQEELTAEERARRTLLEERGRIARELHDVVAHHMSVISIQVQVAPHLVEDLSPELKENLAGIRGNALEALTELRRVLGVLRSDSPSDETAGQAPQPTLARLGELVGNVRAAGLTVETATTGEPRPLSPGVELSAFRIVQEAMSNAMRHAPGARVRVEIGYRPAALTVRITNSAPTAPAQRPSGHSPGPGHGLLGMRERAAMLGGDLAVGPTPEGGYEVAATLPLTTSADSSIPPIPAKDDR